MNLERWGDRPRGEGKTQRGKYAQRKREKEDGNDTHTASRGRDGSKGNKPGKRRKEKLKATSSRGTGQRNGIMAKC